MSIDPRGPMRTVVSVEGEASVTLVTLSCGHVGNFATHFHYKVGSATHCIECRRDDETRTTQMEQGDRR